MIVDNEEAIGAGPEHGGEEHGDLELTPVVPALGDAVRAVHGPCAVHGDRRYLLMWKVCQAKRLGKRGEVPGRLDDGRAAIDDPSERYEFETPLAGS